ncbi:metal-dependent transcriptional regulator [Halalkalirubrum salinum]|uniref:metal-dependent transcriptional regulator n=1 Tax=Halalkalirubrum salinum TaxID=2563889 RepID=UPI0010FBBB0D|nr:metal-dependent transcriptional regulator [Halalkalirubrum salinum]
MSACEQGPCADVSASDTDLPAVSGTVGRYLVAIYEAGRAEDPPVGTGTVADRLGIEPGSVTEMFCRLGEDDLVKYEKGAGVELTGHGRAAAETLVHRRCLVENFFETILSTKLPAETAYAIAVRVPADGFDRLGRIATSHAAFRCRLDD